MKIGILIPSTSKGRDWRSYKETYLYELTLKTFLITYDKEHSYVFYIGVDKNDKIYDSEKEIKQITCNKKIFLCKQARVLFGYISPCSTLKKQIQLF